MKKIIAIVGFLGLLGSAATNVSAAYFNTTPIARCETQITGTLQMGMESVEVHMVQLMLVNAGFLNAAPNGYFGSQTRQAVMAFQANNGISPTGIVGPSTRNAINERMCDVDLLDNSSHFTSYNSTSYGYSDGVTYVSEIDPYVQVVSPVVTSPAIYNNPGSNSSSIAYNAPSNTVINAAFSSTPVTNYNGGPSFIPLGAAQASTPVQSTNIIYSPSIGYTYGIVPQSGSITVSSPVANAIYNEGDTVYVSWGTNNINSIKIFSILLESNISGQSKIVSTTSSFSRSFVLTKELLDSVCAGSCNNNQQGSFRVVVSTPTTDIAGISSNLRATIAPITIKRPLPQTAVSISASKTPVNSGEIFRLYVNMPTSAIWNGYQYGSHSFRIRAICQSSVQVSIAGTPCGQDFSMPSISNNAQQEIPAVITNSSWFKQDVTFVITAVNAQGQTIGVGETKVTANAAPFNF